MKTSSAPFQSLNGMQQMMLRWEEIHPVNASHVVELGEWVSPSAAQSALDRALEILGLGPVEFSPRRTAYRYHKPEGSSPCIATYHGADADTVFQAMLDDELNRPFAKYGPEWPFRFAYLSADDGRCWLVVSYRHAVTDARGVLLIARCWLRALFGLSQTGSELSTNAPLLEKLFPGDLGWSKTPRRAWEVMRELRESFTCFRAPSQSGRPQAIAGGLHARQLSVTTIKTVAKGLAVTVQDLLFAAMLEGLGLLFADDLTGKRRDRIALYAPADLRRNSSEPLDSVMGQYLGSMMVRERITPGRRFSDLVREINRQTQAIKASREYIAHATHLSHMAMLWDMFPERYNRVIGPRLIPITSVVTNVNLSELLSREITAGFVVDYHRFTGTGILTPMMAGLTTVGSNVNLTSTRHTDVFTADQHSQLMRHVERRLIGSLPDVASGVVFHSCSSPPMAAPIKEQRPHTIKESWR